jgi:hypothetical protein
MKKKKEQYVVKTGFNYGADDKRHDEGEGPISLPADVAAQLLAAGAIEVYVEGKN